MECTLQKISWRSKIIISPIRDTERFILGSAYNTFSDDQGRIVIPEVLASFAKLTETVSFIGLGDRVEIWSSELWEDKQKFLAKEAFEIIEKLAKEQR